MAREEEQETERVVGCGPTSSILRWLLTLALELVGGSLKVEEVLTAMAERTNPSLFPQRPCGSSHYGAASSPCVVLLCSVIRFLRRCLYDALKLRTDLPNLHYGGWGAALDPM